MNLRKESMKNEIVKNIFVSLITSFIVLAILYFFKLKYIENFIPKYGFYLFFIILSYSIILPSLIHVRAYKTLPCMTGMMIGMTIGMISGFLSGFFVASTNGMFFGSIFGMIIGITFGISMGKCCGIMGIMEGMMAGFMGGLMGAMTAFMLLNDHLKTTSIIVFAVSSVILIGLHYMIYKETIEMERKHKDSLLFTISWSFLLTVITILIMVFGPRSVFLQ
jgi:hypothetical protein